MRQRGIIKRFGTDPHIFEPPGAPFLKYSPGSRQFWSSTTSTCFISEDCIINLACPIDVQIINHSVIGQRYPVLSPPSGLMKLISWKYIPKPRICEDFGDYWDKSTGFNPLLWTGKI